MRRSKAPKNSHGLPILDGHHKKHPRFNGRHFIEVMPAVPEWSRPDTCRRKRAFEDLHDAIMAANQHRSPLHVYECPVCGKFHLTKRESGPLTP